MKLWKAETKRIKKGSRPTEIRFFEKITYEPNSGCWLWLAFTEREYGRFLVSRNKGVWAHRFSWEYHNKKKIPKGKFILHKCDTPSCVNPNHLEIGTQRDNVDDMIKKGRHPTMGKTHCINGHEFTKENTQMVKKKDRPRHHRVCRECIKVRIKNKRRTFAEQK